MPTFKLTSLQLSFLQVKEMQHQEMTTEKLLQLDPLAQQNICS